VRVLLFAALRDAAGPTVEVNLPAGATVRALRAELARVLPSALLARSAIAVNHEYADDSCEVRAGDEVAVIPPVSGG
jgi:molybdopterin converting factor subunit 1